MVGEKLAPSPTIFAKFTFLFTVFIHLFLDLDLFSFEFNVFRIWF